MLHGPDSAYPLGKPQWLGALVEVLGEHASGEQAGRLRSAAAGAQWPVGLQPIHRWRAQGVLLLLANTLVPQRPALEWLQQLHQRAALGVSGSLGEWRAALAPVLQPLYRRAYAYDAAYAQAHASAALELAARAYTIGDGAAYASLAGPLARVCAWVCSPGQHTRPTVYARMAEQLLASLVATASNRTASPDAGATFSFKR